MITSDKQVRQCSAKERKGKEGNGKERTAWEDSGGKRVDEWIAGLAKTHTQLSSSRKLKGEKNTG